MNLWKIGCNSGLPVSHLHIAYDGESDGIDGGENGNKEGNATATKHFAHSDVRGLHVDQRKGMLPFTGQSHLKWLKCAAAHSSSSSYSRGSETEVGEVTAAPGVGIHGVQFSNAALLQAYLPPPPMAVRFFNGTSITKKKTQPMRRTSRHGKRRNRKSLLSRFEAQEKRLARDEKEAKLLLARSSKLNQGINGGSGGSGGGGSKTGRVNDGDGRSSSSGGSSSNRGGAGSGWGHWRGWGAEAGLILTSACSTAHGGGGVTSRSVPAILFICSCVAVVDDDNAT